MSNHEEIFPKIDAVIYLSYTSNSQKVALFCNEFLNYKLLEAAKADFNSLYNNVLLIYPVHSQDIPKNLYPLLKEIKCNRMIAIATYGRIKHGNSLFRLRYEFKLPLIGACYFPVRHSYLKNDTYEPNYGSLMPLLRRFQENDTKIIDIKRSKSTPGYRFFPKERAALSVKITFDSNKCISCNRCGLNCINHAIQYGKINHHNCISCLACFTHCHTKALDFKISKILKIYLKNQRSNSVEIYSE